MKDGGSSSQKYNVVTFDCYGTLIDWEKGLRTAFDKPLGRTPDLRSREDSRLFELYEQAERRFEAETPFREYREIMRLSAVEVLNKLGKKIPLSLTETLAEDLPKWKPFPETNPALERIGANHELGILSNVDDDLLEKTMKHFSVPFRFVVTAQHVQSYKPRPKHFDEAKRIIGHDKKWLHVGASRYHDIEPAVALGIPSVWVNRQSPQIEKGQAGIVTQIGSLTELAAWLDSR